MKIKKICIVGYGLHVKNVIIPSLKLKNKNIKIVTKKEVKNFETFSNIKEALKKLSKDFIFFNSTPPKLHYSISKLILTSGFNVIVEKPLCLNIDQFIKINNLAKKKNLFLFENMMYFYSKQFQVLKNILKKKYIKQIYIKFSIPNFNKNSFRSENSLNSSILYDIGCYPFSLISYFGFNPKDLKVLCKTKNGKITLIESSFVSKKIKFKIIISIYELYENYIKVIFKNNSYYHLNHFFYGKKIKKINYFYQSNKKLKKFKIYEDNLFKYIFNYSNQKFLKLSKSQFLIIKNYLSILNKIKIKLNYSPN